MADLLLEPAVVSTAQKTRACIQYNHTHTAHTGGLIPTDVHAYFPHTREHSFYTAQSALCTQRSECVGRLWQGIAKPGWWFLSIVKAWAVKGWVLPTSVLLWPPGAHVWHSGARLSLSITCIETWVLLWVSLWTCVCVWERERERERLCVFPETQHLRVYSHHWTSTARELVSTTMCSIATTITRLAVLL